MKKLKFLPISQGLNDVHAKWFCQLRPKMVSWSFFSKIRTRNRKKEFLFLNFQFLTKIFKRKFFRWKLRKRKYFSSELSQAVRVNDFLTPRSPMECIYNRTNDFFRIRFCRKFLYFRISRFCEKILLEIAENKTVLTFSKPYFSQNQNQLKSRSNLSLW